MNNKPYSLEFLAEKINPILVRDDRIEAAYLLGSTVSGRLHPKSDIDLAILPADPTTPLSIMNRLSLSACLQDELANDVDIGILGTHDLIYATQ